MVLSSETCICLYICCRGVKYHEPEYWKFGDEGNKYFRHATGQIYAISKDLAAYISINQLFPDCHMSCIVSCVVAFLCA